MRVAVCIRDFPTDANAFIPVGREFDLSFQVHTCGSTKVAPESHPHFFRTEERPDGPWEPMPGETYHCIDNDFTPMISYRTHKIDERRIAVGNCFQTKAEVEDKLPGVRAALTGKSLRDVLDAAHPEIRKGIADFVPSDRSVFGLVDALIEIVLKSWEKSR